jgi:proline iminopeptidase
LLREAHRLSAIPGVLIQGSLDLQGPPKTAFELARAWPNSELVLVANAGHSVDDKAMAEAIVSAVDRFADTA